MRTTCRSLIAGASVLAALQGCGGSGDDESVDLSASSVVPGHDLALYYLRNCNTLDARVMAKLAVSEGLSEAEGEALVRHVDTLIELTKLAEHHPAHGPIADGCLQSLFGGPYRDRNPESPWRGPEEIAFLTDTLDAMDDARDILTPATPPAKDPRFTYELAAVLCSLDQHDRVDALLAAVPEASRHGFWHPYIATLSAVRRAVAADWRDYAACDAAVATLDGLLATCEADQETLPMAPVVLFNMGIIERHQRHAELAAKYIQAALVHAEARGKLRAFFITTWARL